MGISQGSGLGRVGAGQHLMRAHDDIFLSRTRDPCPDGVDRHLYVRHLYVRQLRDWNSWCR